MIRAPASLLTVSGRRPRLHRVFTPAVQRGDVLGRLDRVVYPESNKASAPSVLEVLALSVDQKGCEEHEPIFLGVLRIS